MLIIEILKLQNSYGNIFFFFYNKHVKYFIIVFMIAFLLQ